MKKIKILLDNGHGNNTPGKASPDRMLLEYAWTRDVAKRVLIKLRDKGYDADLVVPEYYDVSLTTRISRVNNVCKKLGNCNVLLVSIHNNASGNGTEWCKANGFSVFVAKNASQESKSCAVKFTELAIAHKLTGNRSIPAGKYWTWSWTTADIAILKKTHCPAVLTENMFMDNKEDCEFLLSENGRQTLADLHVAAIINYINTL